MGIKKTDHAFNADLLYTVKIYKNIKYKAEIFKIQPLCINKKYKNIYIKFLYENA